jgi:hypothetical protein
VDSHKVAKSTRNPPKLAALNTTLTYKQGQVVSYSMLDLYKTSEDLYTAPPSVVQKTDD